LVCEFTDPISITEDEAKHKLHTIATNIQYILPEIREK
jgi:hypothetical protein